jgi:hypothetical protein
MIYGHFRRRRHLMTAGGYRRARAKALRIWQEGICVVKQHKSLCSMGFLGITDVGDISKNTTR